MTRRSRIFASAVSRSVPLPLLRMIKQARDAFADRTYKAQVGLPKNFVSTRELSTELILRFLPDRTEMICGEHDDALFLNTAAFPGQARTQVPALVHEALEHASAHALRAKKTLLACLDLRPLSDDLLAAMAAGGIGYEAIDSVLDVILNYRSGTTSFVRSGPLPGRNALPEYDATMHPALVRYGNAELRVVQNYLTNRNDQRTALERLAANTPSERRMYAPSHASTYLTADDPEWNLRRLMTNAGFYVGDDPVEAWRTLENWVNRYISALRNSHLVWHNNFVGHFLKCQLAISEKYGVLPRYVRAPAASRIYDQICGREVLFLSPLAHLVQEQISSGRLWRLYRNYEVPAFSLRAIHAFVSTWPNRPHGDWSETFERVCEAIDMAWRERPFEVFIASCGCYGLPVCDHVRARYGCSVVYVGNSAHALFGIRQRSTRTAMDVDPEMWIDSDLDRYANMRLIDSGSYISP